MEKGYCYTLREYMNTDSIIYLKRNKNFIGTQVQLNLYDARLLLICRVDSLNLVSICMLNVLI